MPDDREVLFGTDLKLMESAGMVDLVSDRSGGLALAVGNINISQALYLRLMVRQGELAPLGLPDYGSRLHELVGQPNNQRTRIIAMGLARTAVEQDPRVKQVLKVEAQQEEHEILRINMDIELILENTPLNLVFDLRLGNR